MPLSPARAGLCLAPRAVAKSRIPWAPLLLAVFASSLVSAQVPTAAPPVQQLTAALPAAPASAPLTSPLPDAPGVSSSAAATGAADDTSQAATPAQSSTTSGQQPPSTTERPHQTKRILGIVPNYRSVTADQHLPPQPPKEKFTAALHDSFDYGSFVLAAVQAGFAMNSDSYPEFHQGVAGYGRYYWHTLADTADENLLVGGIYPTVLRQDARFYTLGHGSIGRRAVYAFSRTLITRTDGGRETFNFSEIMGAGSAAGISSTYYPAQYRTWTKVGQKWLTQVVIDGANFTFKEFWPDINQHVFHNRGGMGSGTQ